uniref:Transposase, IS4 family protein n=1 Tax=Nostoc flagelliforme str. Sunitezuoqi TaxID=676037 RepID=E7DQ15_9NOSO|nr:transposase, IS4 family protein [Nostoc flagelliforme str. Sunitezuoqi]
MAETLVFTLGFKSLWFTESTRHYVETVFSGITGVFPKFIHACTWKGFLLKVEAFIFSFTLQQAFIE